MGEQVVRIWDKQCRVKTEVLPDGRWRVSGAWGEFHVAEGQTEYLALERWLEWARRQPL